MRKLMILVVCILLGLGIALAFSFIRGRGSEYQATAKVELVPDEGEQVVDMKAELSTVEEIVKNLEKPVRVKKQHENTLLISANGKSEKDSIALANQVAGEYAKQDAEKKRNASEEEAELLEKQLEEKYRPQLQDAEERLQKFMSENKPPLGGSKPQQVRSINNQISRLKSERSRLQRAINSLDNSSTPLGKLTSLQANYPQFYGLRSVKLLYKLRSELINLLQKYTKGHPDVQKKSRKIDTTIASVEKEAKRTISAQISKINTDIKPLLAQQNALKSQDNNGSVMSSTEYKRLKEDRDTKDRIYKQKEKELAEYQEWAKNPPGNVNVVDAKDDVRRVPVTPHWRTILNEPTVLIGGAIGLLVGLIIAFFPRSSSLSPNKIASLEDSLGTAILGVIPHIDFEASEHQEAPELESFSIKAQPSADGEPDVSVEVVTSEKPTIPGVESFRVLRTNILFKERNKAAISLLFTSERKEEGKSTIASNLAVSIAQSGKRTLLIDGNLQNPQIHELFELNPVPGLTELLQKSSPINEAVRSSTDILFGNMELEELLKTPGIDNLHLLLVGEKSPSAEELLVSAELPRLLDELKGYYDIIMIDGSSISMGKEALIWSARADGVILIHRSAKPKRSFIKRTKKTLEEISANLWGVVLNDTKVESG